MEKEYQVSITINVTAVDEEEALKFAVDDIKDLAAGGELVGDVVEYEPIKNQQSLLMFGNEYKQKVYCCKQPTSGEYAVGLTWSVINEDFNSYQPSALPPTKDSGLEQKMFEGKDWRAAEKYAIELSEKHQLEYYVCR